METLLPVIRVIKAFTHVHNHINIDVYHDVERRFYFDLIAYVDAGHKAGYTLAHSDHGNIALVPCDTQHEVIIPSDLLVFIGSVKLSNDNNNGNNTLSRVFSNAKDVYIEADVNTIQASAVIDGTIHMIDVTWISGFRTSQLVDELIDEYRSILLSGLWHIGHIYVYGITTPVYIGKMMYLGCDITRADLKNLPIVNVQGKLITRSDLLVEHISLVDAGEADNITASLRALTR